MWNYSLNCYLSLPFFLDGSFLSHGMLKTFSDGDSGGYFLTLLRVINHASINAFERTSLTFRNESVGQFYFEYCWSKIHYWLDFFETVYFVHELLRTCPYFIFLKVVEKDADSVIVQTDCRSVADVNLFNVFAKHICHVKTYSSK